MEKKKNCSILLLDDDEPYCIVTANLLASRGWEVEYRSTPKEAMELLDSADWDILLLDIDLGEGHIGSDLLPKFIKAHPTLQVIMISSVSDINIGVECMKKGAFDYLTKPYKPEELERVIPLALERKKLIALNRLYLEIIIHDLKNPLQNIQMGLDSLNELLPSTDAGKKGRLRQKAFNLADFGARQVETTIRNILGIGQMKSLNALPEKICFNPGTEINRSLNHLIRRIEYTGRSWIVENSMEFEISISKDLFLRVIENLTANALRFAAKGTPISLIFKKEGNQFITGIKNIGSYIEDEKREAVFDKFYKPTFKGTHKGLNFGLGLTFCKAAATAMGGKIYITGEKEEPSTTFWLELPYS